jgi:hypothetical protein
MDTIKFAFVNDPPAPVVASHNHSVNVIEVPTYVEIISFAEAVTTTGDELDEVVLFTAKGVVALNNAGEPFPPVTTTYAYMVVLAAVALVMALKDQAIFHLKPG